MSTFNLKSSLIRAPDGRPLGLWPSDLDPTATPLTQRAWAVARPDAANSAIGVLALAERDRQAVQNDLNLSAQGKASRIAAIAKSRLANLQPLARAVEALAAEYVAREAGALQLPEASLNDTMVDLALAQHVRAADEGITRLRMTDDRTRLAVSRLPAALSGLTPAAHSTIRHSMIAGSTARDLDAESQAIAIARSVVQGSLDTLVAFTSEVTHGELVALFGDSWRIGGSVTAADRQARIAELLGQPTRQAGEPAAA